MSRYPTDLVSLLESSSYIPMAQICERLSVTRRSVHRYIKTLEQEYGVKVLSKKGSGYRIEPESKRHEIPGHRMTSEDALGQVVLCSQLLHQLIPTSIVPELVELRRHLHRAVSPHDPSTSLYDKIRVLSPHRRAFPEHLPNLFNDVFRSIINNKQVRCTYSRRSTGESESLLLSPIGLVYYRDHWYLDGWDMRAQEIRVLSLDRFKKFEISMLAGSIGISVKDIKHQLRAGYGIFCGEVTGTADLLFSAKARRWVENEIWHTDAVGRVDKNGSYRLSVPYSDHTELIGEILRWTGDVEVLGPRELRQAVKSRIQQASRLYQLT